MKGYDGLDGIELVMDRGGRASEMVDLVHFQEERLNDVMSDEFEIGIPEMVHHVFFPSCEEIVNHNHGVSPANQPIHQVGPDETGPAGHHHAEPLPFNP